MANEGNANERQYYAGRMAKGSKCNDMGLYSAMPQGHCAELLHLIKSKQLSSVQLILEKWLIYLQIMMASFCKYYLALLS